MQTFVLLTTALLAMMNVNVEASNAKGLFSTMDNGFLEDNVFAALPTDDLKRLGCVDRKLRRELGPVLEKRRDQDAIHQLIKELAQTPLMSCYLSGFSVNRTGQITNQCIDGFTGWLRNLIIGHNRAPIKDEELEITLTNLTTLLSAYREKYGFDKNKVEGFEKFILLHRQNQEFIKIACGGEPKKVDEMESHVMNLEFLFEAIAVKIGYTTNEFPIINFLPNMQDGTKAAIRELWDICNKGFEDLKKVAELSEQEQLVDQTLETLSRVRAFVSRYD